MFPNIGQMMDMIPKLEEFSKKVIGVVESIQQEQKEQRAMLAEILDHQRKEKEGE